MNKKDEILNKLCQKAATKQLVYRTSKDVFKELKIVLKEIAENLVGQFCTIDKHVQIEYKDKGEFEAELRFSGDVLIFHFHSNTFHFDKSHHIWNSSYAKTDEYRTYCGVINFPNAVIDKVGLKSILQEAILFAMDFELLTPPFNDVQVVTLNQIKEMSQNMKIKPAKRLGFRFSNEK